MTRAHRIAFASGLVAFALDVATKELVLAKLPFGRRITVIDGFFDLVQARNPGFVFSFLADAPALLRGGVVVGVIGFVTVLAWRMLREPGTPGRVALALGLILGGALGNVLDRIRHGAVVDFLRFHWQHALAWPTFNLADSFIVVAAALLAVDALRAPHPPREDPGPPPAEPGAS